MKNIRLITILAVFAMLHRSALGCVQSQSQSFQIIAPPSEPPVLWYLCCLNPRNHLISNCKGHTSANATNFYLSCSTPGENIIMFLTCLEGHPPLCSLMESGGQIYYNGTFYNTGIEMAGIQIVLMLNKVTNSQFFSKTKNEMRNVMIDHKFPNFEDNNYWIGLDQMEILTKLKKPTSLFIYVNSDESLNLRYDEFKVDNYDKNYNMTLDKFSGPQYLNLLYSGFGFKGKNELPGKFCFSPKPIDISGWWYAENIGYFCSASILTTNDGMYGWSSKNISSALLTFGYKMI